MMLQYATQIEEQEYTSKKIHRFFPALANVSFILYLFFSVFGTGLPFREKLDDISDIGTSNIVNQIAFTAIFFLSLLSILPKIKTAAEILWREKIFTLFLLWCIASVAWSDYSFVSFKRVFQFATAFLVILSAVSYVEYSEVLLKRIKYLFLIYVVLSFISIFTIPGAKDFYGIWRGLAPSKNHLGQAALVSSLVLFYSVWTERGIKRYFSTAGFMLSLILLVGSESITSVSTFIFILFLGIIFYIDRYMKNLSIGRFLTVITILAGTAFFFIVVFMAPDIIASLAGAAGRDLTFTGRTHLWEDVLLEAQKHWILGAGYQGFWVVDNPHLLALYEIYVWLPNQAHNGYIDILNELGVIGLTLFVLIILNYFTKLVKHNIPQYWKWFAIAAVIINFQESTFIRPQVLTGVMFMFSYMALISDICRQEKEFLVEESEEEM